MKIGDSVEMDGFFTCKACFRTLRLLMLSAIMGFGLVAPLSAFGGDCSSVDLRIKGCYHQFYARCDKTTGVGETGCNALSNDGEGVMVSNGPWYNANFGPGCVEAGGVPDQGATPGGHTMYICRWTGKGK